MQDTENNSLIKDRSPSFNTETIYSQQNQSASNENILNMNNDSKHYIKQMPFEQHLQKLSIEDLLNNVQNSPSQETRSTCENQIITLLTQQQQQISQSNEYISSLGNQSIFPIMCKEHPNEEIHFSCYTCNNQVLCIECVTQGVHKLHEVKNIKSAQNDITTTIQSVLQNVKEKIESQNQEADQLINKKNEAIELVSDLKNTISDSFNQISQKLAQKQLELENKCQEYLQDQMKFFEKTIKKKKRKMKIYLDSHKIIENQVNSLNQQDLFYYYLDKQSVLQELQNYSDFSEDNLNSSLINQPATQNLQLNLSFNMKNLQNQIQQIDLVFIHQDQNTSQEQQQLYSLQQQQQKSFLNDQKKDNSISQIILEKHQDFTKQKQLNQHIQQNLNEIQQTRKLQQRYNDFFSKNNNNSIDEQEKYKLSLEKEDFEPKKFYLSGLESARTFSQNQQIQKSFQRENSFEKLSEQLLKDRTRQRNQLFKSQLEETCNRSFKHSQSPQKKSWLKANKNSILEKKQNLQQKNLNELQEFYINSIQRNKQHNFKEFRDLSPSLKSFNEVQNYLNRGKQNSNLSQLQQQQNKNEQKGYLISQQQTKQKQEKQYFSAQNSPQRAHFRSAISPSQFEISSIKKEQDYNNDIQHEIKNSEINPIHNIDQQYQQYSFNKLNESNPINNDQSLERKIQQQQKLQQQQIETPDNSFNTNAISNIKQEIQKYRQFLSNQQQ